MESLLSVIFGILTSSRNVENPSPRHYFFGFIGGAIFVLVAIFLIEVTETGFSKAILGLVHNFFPGGLAASLIGGVAGTSIFWFPRSGDWLQVSLQQHIRSAEKSMKVRCVRIFDTFGREVDSSPWLTISRSYHVMSIEISPDGKRAYGIATAERTGEWPTLGSHRIESFEIVSTLVPASWRVEVQANGAVFIAPGAWLTPGFFEAFSDREPDAYPIFKRERDLIVSGDP
jgi:hypothetical protein